MHCVHYKSIKNYYISRLYSCSFLSEICLQKFESICNNCLSCEFFFCSNTNPGAVSVFVLMATNYRIIKLQSCSLQYWTLSSFFSKKKRNFQCVKKINRARSTQPDIPNIQLAKNMIVFCVFSSWRPNC